MLIKFITTLAWIFGISSFILLLARIIGAITYSEHDRAMDALKGVVATFPLHWPFIITVICWVWLFVKE